jgi:transposase
MGNPVTADPRETTSGGWQGPVESRKPRGAKRHSVGIADRGGLAGSARPISFASDLPPAFPGMAAGRGAGEDPANAGQGLEGTRRVRPVRMLHRRLLCRRKKGGRAVGKTKRGKGTKVMALADGHGLPVAVHIESASPNEVTLVEATLASRFILAKPKRLIGDGAYDSDPLDRRLRTRGIEMIAPHPRNRTKPATQDGRQLRRYKRRWKIERLNAWLQNFRRVTVRYEHIAENYLGLLHLACIMILLKVFLR